MYIVSKYLRFEIVEAHCLVLYSQTFAHTQGIIACSIRGHAGKGRMNRLYRSCSAVHPELGVC